MSKRLGENQLISKAQIEKIRTLDDFDLTMLISEIHDHGWPAALKTLEKMPSWRCEGQQWAF
jgi:hypothetical protein